MGDLLAVFYENCHFVLPVEKPDKWRRFGQQNAQVTEESGHEEHGVDPHGRLPSGPRDLADKHQVQVDVLQQEDQANQPHRHPETHGVGGAQTLHAKA